MTRRQRLAASLVPLVAMCSLGLGGCGDSDESEPPASPEQQVPAEDEPGATPGGQDTGDEGTGTGEGRGTGQGGGGY